MKIVYEGNDIKKLKDVTLSIDVTNNLLTLAVSKIHFHTDLAKQRTISQIELIHVESIEIQED